MARLVRLVIQVLLLVSLLATLGTATLTPSNKKRTAAAGNANTKKPKAPPKEPKVNSGPQEQNVFERELVQEEPSSRDIYMEHATYSKNTDVRQFNGTVLGYVTPWNNHGYDVAKWFGPKFDVISPVWLQVRRIGDGKYEIQGTHDIDQGWVKDVRKAANGKNKVLPRILFDQFTDTDFSKLLTHQYEQQAAIASILNAVRKYNFDGIVLEIWSQLSARVDDPVLIGIVIAVAKALRAQGKQMILVVPPHREHMHDLFSAAHFEQLEPHVTAFSLMTYDFSSIDRPGPNAPKYWVRQAVRHICPDGVPNVAQKRQKILIGLNMYGNDFTTEGGGSIVGRQYLEFVRGLQARLQWDEKDEENYFEVKDDNGRHFIFYPSLYSINQRIQMAKELGCGLSLWELGQGLDYFYDLL